VRVSSSSAAAASLFGCRFWLSFGCFRCVVVVCQTVAVGVIKEVKKKSAVAAKSGKK